MHRTNPDRSGPKAVIAVLLALSLVIPNVARPQAAPSKPAARPAPAMPASPQPSAEPTEAAPAARIQGANAAGYQEAGVVYPNCPPPPANAQCASPRPATRAPGATARARPAPPVVIDVSRPEMRATDLRVGESRLVRGLKASRVVMGTDKIATATVLDNREVILFGNGSGVSTLQIWDLAGRMRSFEVTVLPATTDLLAEQMRLLLADIPGLKISAIGDRVVIDGRDLADDNLRRIAALTQGYDQVVNLTAEQEKYGGWDEMVAMDVKVVEFKNKDRLRELGIKWDNTINGPMAGVGADFHVSAMDGGAGFYVNPSTDANIQGVNNLVRPLSPFRTYAGWISILYSKINLMASDGDATVLAEPQLTSRSGKPASMNVGGRIPIVMNGFGTSDVRWEQYGVKLAVTPWVNQGGSIKAKIKAEVSEIDPAIVVQGVPGFRERVVETVFNVKDGQTMVLSGLLQHTKATSVSKVPYLGDVPLLGALFRSTRDEERDSEVVIFVTPRVVTPDSEQVTRRLERVNRRTQAAFSERPATEAAPAQPAQAPDLDTTR